MNFLTTIWARIHLAIHAHQFFEAMGDQTAKMATLQARNSFLEDALTSLCAKDDNGVWTTVHEADTPVTDEVAMALELVYAE